MVNEGAHHLFRLNTEETSQSTKHILGRHHPRPHPGFHCYDSPNCITQYCSNCAQHCCFITVFWGRGALRPNAGHGLLIHEVSKSYTTMHHSRQDSSGRVISSSQRPLPDNTQHLQQTNIHAPGGIRNHDLSRRAAVDLPLRPRGHWDRPLLLYNDNGKYNSDNYNVLLFPHNLSFKLSFHNLGKHVISK